MAAGAENVTPIRPPVEGNVWSALLKAQAEFKPIGKTTRGARGNYAPLDEVIESLRPVLTKHDLVSTATTVISDGHLFLVRKLVHAPSGTDITGDAYPVAPISKTPQEIGSALTYARRYTFLAICDVHPSDEDDDGASAGKQAQTRQQVAPQPRPEPKPFVPTADQMERSLTAVETMDELDAWYTANAEHVRALTDTRKRNQLMDAYKKLSVSLDSIPV